MIWIWLLTAGAQPELQSSREHTRRGGSDAAVAGIRLDSTYPLGLLREVLHINQKAVHYKELKDKDAGFTEMTR